MKLFESKTLHRFGYGLAVAAVAAWSYGAVPALAQGRGGGAGGGQGQRGSATAQRGGSQGAGQQARGGAGRGAQDRIHVSDPQRDQFRDTTGTADQVHRQARDMARATGGAGFDTATLRQQRDRIHDHVQTMLHSHDQLMAGFGDADRARLQDRVHQMDQTRDRLHTCLSNLDRELANPEPDRARIRNEVQELNRAAKQWRKQVQKLGSDLELG